MTYKKKLIIKLVFLFAAAAIILTLGIINGGYLFSLGTSMAIMGVALTVKFAFIFSNKEKLRELENSAKDERTAFVAGKSYSFAFWLSLVAEYGAVCVLYWLKMEPTAMILNYVICFQAVAYVVSYLYFNRKY